MGSPADDTVRSVADMLVAEQQEGRYGWRFWPEEEAFTGMIVTGLVDAYNLTSDKAYLAAAENGGGFMLWIAESNFFGSEALACARMSSTVEPGQVNVWRVELKYFYNAVSVYGTETFISSFAGDDPSEVVVFLSEYVLAAYELGAADRGVWRQGLINWLSAVDDSSTFPVMALGAATWALASTGPMDETLIDPFGNGKPDWALKKLEDLPWMLAGHQVPAGQPDAGSFYWRFDHLDGGLWKTDPTVPISGYTEDAVYATLGLLAAAEANRDVIKADPNNPTQQPDIASAIDASREVLLGAVSAEGEVFELLSKEGKRHDFYAAELLMVLTRLPVASEP